MGENREKTTHGNVLLAAAPNWQAPGIKMCACFSSLDPPDGPCSLPSFLPYQLDPCEKRKSDAFSRQIEAKTNSLLPVLKIIFNEIKQSESEDMTSSFA